MDNKTMRAVVVTGPGGPEVLNIGWVAKPEAYAGDVLVRVKASALNRADVLQRRGLYPPPAGVTDIPGLEFAGEVEAVGSNVRLWKPGQRVLGLVAGGAHAEYVVTPERMLAEAPSHLTWPELAAIPEAFITAHDALWVQAELRVHERVLIHAVGSGVGLAALQLTRAMNAAAVGTSRTEAKLQQSKSLGLEAGFLVPSAPTPEMGKQWAASGGFDVVLDLVGGPYTNASLHALATRGRMMLVGTMAGGRSEVDLGLMLHQRATVIGTALRARPLEEKIAVTQAFSKEVLPLFSRSILRPTVDSEFALADIRQAHQRMESNQTFGKIVLRMSE